MELISLGTYRSCCLTHIQLLGLGNRSYLLTTGTDGYITFWPVDNLQTQETSRFSLSKRDSSQDKENFDTDLKWDAQHRIHQSSIKCLTSRHLSDGSVIIATGGDDNALALTHITLDAESSHLPICSTLLLTRAHASTITDIQCLGPGLDHGQSDTSTLWTFATVSNDQRLKTWVLTIDSRKPAAEGLSVRQGSSQLSSIADASCMEITPGGRGEMKIMVAGIGIETWNVSDV